MNDSPSQIIPAAGLWHGRLLLFNALPSTNQWALEHAGELGHGDVVRAVQQTAGRGRFQRVWVSPADRCLTLSVVLDPLRIGLLQAATRIGALGVCTALEDQGLAPQVKWPNDVLIGMCKVAGILAEREGDKGPVILGIGLNVNTNREDITAAAFDYPTTSMAIEGARQYEVDAVCKALVAGIERTFDRAAVDEHAFVETEWRKRDALWGRDIRVKTQTGTVAGEYLGLNPDGELLLRDAQGNERCFAAGDVTLG